MMYTSSQSPFGEIGASSVYLFPGSSRQAPSSSWRFDLRKDNVLRRGWCPMSKNAAYLLRLTRLKRRFGRALWTE